ncbi:MAG: Gfo/Idh/MocA family oxidoreductase [Planctomycetes bacterium]|nr:Gfo/Idh/MocA family oxidoreductase [Planctomycetota bacterium]
MKSTGTKIGIIGCGAIGTVHARHAARAGLEVAAIWDVKPEAAKLLSGDAPSAETMPNVEALLARADIAGVVVAVPNNMHMPLAVQSLKAGKHVLLEKPMALSAAECDAILKACRETGKQLQMGFVCRQLPTVSTAKKLVESGTFGSLYHIKASTYRRRGVPGLGGWFTDKKRSGGGPLIDLGVHIIDASLWLAGYPKVERVSGAIYSNFGRQMKNYAHVSMWAGPPRFDGVCDVEDHATALLRCAGGLTIELNTTWAMNIPDGALPDGVILFGQKAGCHIGLHAKRLTLATETHSMPADLEPHFLAEDPLKQAWDLQASAFRSLLESGTKPIATAEEGRCVQAVIDAVYRSAELGREVEV